MAAGYLEVRADYQLQRFDKTTLQSGNWPADTNIAIENLSAQVTGLQKGEQLEFATPNGSQLLSINGVVRHPFVKPPTFGGQVHFLTDAAGGERFGVAADTFRQLLVQISPPYSGEQARTVAVSIRSLLAAQGIPVNVSLLQDPERHWGRPILASVNGVLQILALAALALASVLILNTVSAHLTLQIQQIGVMKALGAKTFMIAKIYVSEVLLLALSAVLLAIPPALAAGYYSSCSLLVLFNIDCGGFVFSPRALLLMLGGAWWRLCWRPWRRFCGRRRCRCAWPWPAMVWVERELTALVLSGWNATSPGFYRRSTQPPWAICCTTKPGCCSRKACC